MFDLDMVSFIAEINSQGCHYVKTSLNIEKLQNWQPMLVRGELEDQQHRLAQLRHVPRLSLAHFIPLLTTKEFIDQHTKFWRSTSSLHTLLATPQPTLSYIESWRSSIIVPASLTPTTKLYRPVLIFALANATIRKCEMAKMKTISLALFLFGLLLVPTPVSAFWRLLCHGQVGVVRIDPLADFGMISDHAHAVHGANSMLMTSSSP